MPQGHGERGRSRNTWKREMETADYRFSWRKMELAAEDRAE